MSSERGRARAVLGLTRPPSHVGRKYHSSVRPRWSAGIAAVGHVAHLRKRSRRRLVGEGRAPGATFRPGEARYLQPSNTDSCPALALLPLTVGTILESACSCRQTLQADSEAGTWHRTEPLPPPCPAAYPRFPHPQGPIGPEPETNGPPMSKPELAKPGERPT
jgi:hypothetical protein